MINNFSAEDYKILEERMKDLKMQELFAEPSSWEDDDDEECHYWFV